MTAFFFFVQFVWTGVLPATISKRDLDLDLAIGCYTSRFFLFTVKLSFCAHKERNDCYVDDPVTRATYIEYIHQLNNRFLTT